MKGSIFPSAGLSRAEIRWEDYLNVLTPVVEQSGLLYKREDYFAPLGAGGVNGSKLRQLIYLIDSYVQSSPLAGLPGHERGVLTGASILSPQLSMATLVARHYGLPTTLVLGGTKPETCQKAENVAIAAAAGAEFIFIPVGYNPAIQRAVRDLHATDAYRGWYRLCYGITTEEDATDASIEAFHAVGARQAWNIPPEVREIVMTAGSCNSCTSVLYGLAQRLAAGQLPILGAVTLIGIGPTRLQWIEDRLAAIERTTGLDIRSRFRRSYNRHADLEEAHQTDGPVNLNHIDLHDARVYSYGDRVPWAQDGIVFHPTYEGKMMKWLELNAPLPRDGSRLVWIVGSAPSRTRRAAP